jgi:hypothetical protein
VFTNEIMFLNPVAQKKLQQEVEEAQEPLDLVNDPAFCGNQFICTCKEKVDSTGCSILEYQIHKFISDDTISQYYVPGPDGKSRKVSNCHLKIASVQDCDVVDAKDNKVLLCFRKGKLKYAGQLESFIDTEVRANENRGAAGGTFDLNRADVNDRMVIGMKNHYEAYVTPKGNFDKALNQTATNPIYSTTIGYFEGGRDQKSKQRCRQTKFTKDHRQLFLGMEDLLCELNDSFEELMREAYDQQCKAVECISEFRIHKTVFTTVTMNRNAVTSMHVDTSDLGSYSPIVTIGNFCGYELCLPQYSFAIDIQPTDLALVNVHEIHCNLPGVNLAASDGSSSSAVVASEDSDVRYGGIPVRHSFVFYARKLVQERCKRNNLMLQALKRKHLSNNAQAFGKKKFKSFINRTSNNNHNHNNNNINDSTSEDSLLLKELANLVEEEEYDYII